MAGIKSITILIVLEWSLLWHAYIIGLISCKLIQLDSYFGKMQTGNFLIEMLRQCINLVIVVAMVFPELDLSKCLIGE